MRTVMLLSEYPYCPDCDGKGKVQVFEEITCTNCKGNPPKGFTCDTCYNKGKLSKAVVDEKGKPVFETCDSCKGSGENPFAFQV